MDGHYEFMRLPFGLKDAPSAFQRIINQVLSGLIGDIEVEYLGHVIIENGIKPQNKKIEAMEGYPQPINLKELQAFLGAANYYRKFISNFADISRPLIDLTRGCKTKDGKTKLAWTQEALDAFHKLRTVLSEDIVLKFPDFSRPFVLVTDAKSPALAHEKPSVCIGPVAKEVRDGNERLARWRMSVAEFDICVEYLPGKDNHSADALSRIRAADQPIDDLVVGVVTRRATTSYKGINRPDSPRSEMLDSSDISSPETIDIWGLDSLRNAQDEDPLWGRVKQYLRGECDLTKDEFKEIPRKIENYQVPDGILYNVLDKPFREVFRVVVPKLYQSTALRYPEVSRPFERVHMDIVGPYPESEGFRYILTVVDALTKYLVAIPLKSKDSLEVAKAFMNGFIYKEGTPRQVIPDGGGEFVNELFKKLTEEFGMDKRTITPYHPSSNGQVERDTAPWYNVEDYLQETRVMGSKIFKRCKEHNEEDIQRRPRDRPYAKPSQIIGGDRVYLLATPKRIADGKERKEHVDRLKLEMSLVRGQAHNIDKAYPTEEKIEEEFEDDDSLETLEDSAKCVGLRNKGKYNLRSNKKEGVSLIIPPNEENLHSLFFLKFKTNAWKFFGKLDEARDLFVEKRDLINCKEIQPGRSVYPAENCSRDEVLDNPQAKSGLCHFPEKKILSSTV
ncbi:uncharacterized protein LOC125039363 [Penaeus chinensis]|uniref:uncharacterized protein LOC125039363 n=1 Tax=Penaeus chinensis TaxID=139456 RepID=UPI001FB80835|nr:uncharacterized protein LOC125039363 [Penaeus chinensis]